MQPIRRPGRFFVVTIAGEADIGVAENVGYTDLIGTVRLTLDKGDEVTFW